MCSQFIFPKPRDWESFEDIISDLLKRRYQTFNLQRFGRSGQKQFGIDIAGPTKLGVLGVQCKHHANINIPISEIDTAIDDAKKFPVSMVELILATSASRDTKAHSHILTLSESRKLHGECPISIIFWEDIVDWLEESPDLLYKHFTKYFPSSSFEHVKFSGPTPKKRSVIWPATSESIHQAVSENLQGVEPVDPYQLTIGINSFSEFRFTGLVDIELQITQAPQEQFAQRNFLVDAEMLRQLKTVISTRSFSKELLVCLQTRLSTGFLFGWMFRGVTGFYPQFVVGDELWVTSGLPSTKSGLFEAHPILLSNESREVVLALSLSRHIGTQVHSSIDDWDQKPRAIIELMLEGNSIRSAAQALSIAREVAWRIKTYVDQWRTERIHVFAAIPIGLAPLITYHLNAICPIDLYFLDSSRAQYFLAGTITNDL